MGPDAVIVVDVGANRLAQIPGRVKLVDVDQLRFEAAKPPLDPDIVGPAGLAVHALPDVEIPQKLFVFLAGELAALVRIMPNSG